MPDELGRRRRAKRRCSIADDLDEGAARYLRAERDACRTGWLATREAATSRDAIDDGVGARASSGAPFGPDRALDAEPARARSRRCWTRTSCRRASHTFVNGDPRQGFDAGNYLTNLTARFFHDRRHRSLLPLAPGVASLPDGRARGLRVLTRLVLGCATIDPQPIAADVVARATGPEAEKLWREIESVTVLKDAAAATIYGARSSNGVIIIERKKAKEGKMMVSARVTTSYTPSENYDRYRWEDNQSATVVDYMSLLI